MGTQRTKHTLISLGAATLLLAGVASLAVAGSRDATHGDNEVTGAAGTTSPDTSITLEEVKDAYEGQQVYIPGIVDVRARVNNGDLEYRYDGSAWTNSPSYAESRNDKPICNRPKEASVSASFTDVRTTTEQYDGVTTTKCTQRKGDGTCISSQDVCAYQRDKTEVNARNW